MRTKHLAPLLTLTFALALTQPAAPAAAALPPLSCGYHIAALFLLGQDVGLCIANENNFYQFAGIKNISPSTIYAQPFRVELTYYAFDQFPDGGNYPIAYSNVVQSLAPNAVLQTNKVTHWLAGVYCTRLYFPVPHKWEDLYCVDTNGTVRRGV